MGDAGDAMELYFLRHGPAATLSEAHVARDSDRPLTAEGTDLTRRVCEGLARLGMRVDVIVSSPLLRARQTADLAAAALGSRDQVVLADELAPGFSVLGLKDIMRRDAGAERILLVGHEPDFSSTVGELIGRGNVKFKKAAAGRVDADEAARGAGVLVWLLQPGMAARGAGIPKPRRSHADG
jgi:phosphohistidine phosphatase